MKKKALFLLVFPAIGCLLGGCNVKQTVKNGLYKVKDTAKKYLEKGSRLVEKYANEDALSVEISYHE